MRLCLSWGVAYLAACNCPNTVYGVHDGDRIATTVEATHPGDVVNLWSAAALTKCTGLNDLRAGTTLVLKAGFSTPADGCPTDNLLLTPQSTNVSSLSASPQYGADWLRFQSDSGCAGREYIQFVVPGSGSNVSLYDNNNSLDGGAVSWFLGRTFFADTADSGCALPSSCSDLFIANNQQR